MASTSFNIRDIKRNDEQKTHLTHSTSVQLGFNKFQHGFNGVANGFDIALQQNRMDVEANVEAVCLGLNIKEQIFLSCLHTFLIKVLWRS